MDKMALSFGSDLVAVSSDQTWPEEELHDVHVLC
jgi:hypothetical protein